MQFQNKTIKPRKNVGSKLKPYIKLDEEYDDIMHERMLKTKDNIMHFELEQERRKALQGVQSSKPQTWAGQPGGVITFDRSAQIYKDQQLDFELLQTKAQGKTAPLKKCSFLKKGSNQKRLGGRISTSQGRVRTISSGAETFGRNSAMGKMPMSAATRARQQRRIQDQQTANRAAFETHPKLDTQSDIPQIQETEMQPAIISPPLQLNYDIPPSPIFSNPERSNKHAERGDRSKRVQQFYGKGQDNTGSLEELIDNLPSQLLLIEEGDCEKGSRESYEMIGTAKASSRPHNPFSDKLLATSRSKISKAPVSQMTTQNNKSDNAIDNVGSYAQHVTENKRLTQQNMDILHRMQDFKMMDYFNLGPKKQSPFNSYKQIRV